MAGKVSMSSIAKKLGVSKNTVSLALRGVQGISENTRRLILDTAAELGYRYKGGRQDEGPRSLCLVIPKSAQNSIDFFSLIQMGIEDEAKKHNMSTIIHYYDENAEGFQTPICVKDFVISGIITLGRVSEKTVRVLDSYKLPVIMVDNYFDDLEIDCVLTDNHSGGYIATEYLLRMGHTDIGFFGNIDYSVSFYDRYMGYCKAMEAHGIKPDRTYSVFLDYMEPETYQEMLKLFTQLKSKGKLPTALFCCNDASAIFLYKVLKNLDISIPGQISVLGFDDIASARNISPELTTMQVKKEWMGRKAVLKLLSILDGNEGIAEKLLLSALLIERDSVRNVKSMEHT